MARSTMKDMMEWNQYNGYSCKYEKESDKQGNCRLSDVVILLIGLKYYDDIHDNVVTPIGFEIC